MLITVIFDVMLITYALLQLVILCSAGPLLISWMLIFCATSVYFLYIARLIAGVGVGAVCTTVPTYISEIAEPRIRGNLLKVLFLTLSW